MTVVMQRGLILLRFSWVGLFRHFAKTVGEVHLVALFRQDATPWSAGVPAHSTAAKAGEAPAPRWLCSAKAPGRAEAARGDRES
jgi:hypothetical protein